MMISVSLFGRKKDVTGWLRLLEQEKVPFRYKGASLKDFSEINILVGFAKKKIKISQKGIYILEPNFNSYSEQEDIAIVKKIEDEDIGKINVHCIAPLRRQKGRTFGQFRLHEAYCDLKYPVVTREKNMFVFSINLSSQLHLQGFGYKQTDNFSNKYPLELHTALIDKEKILRFLRKILIEAFRLAELPYIHPWYYPTFSPTVFLFRQDIDYVDEKGVKNLLEITRKYGIKGTYFVNISGEEEFEDDIGHLKLKKPTTPERKEILQRLLAHGNELANHGYWHYVFDNSEENYKNIRKCSNYLKKLFGIKEKGFAAPGGTWHSVLAKAIDRNNFLYASNNTLGCGGFPYYPYCSGEKVKTLEIPFNPVCAASFEPVIQSSDIEKLKKFYLGYINQQINNNEPITIMGHPHLLGKIAKTFFPLIFNKIVRLKIPNYTLEQFATWWKERQKTRLISTKKEKEIIVESDSPNSIVESILGKKKKLFKVNKKMVINLKSLTS